MNNYHNSGMKELSVQFIRKVTNLTVIMTDQLYY